MATALAVLALVVFLALIHQPGSFLDRAPVDRDRERMDLDLRTRR